MVNRCTLSHLSCIRRLTLHLDLFVLDRKKSVSEHAARIGANINATRRMCNRESNSLCAACSGWPFGELKAFQRNLAARSQEKSKGESSRIFYGCSHRAHSACHEVRTMYGTCNVRSYCTNDCMRVHRPVRLINSVNIESCGGPGKKIFKIQEHRSSVAKPLTLYCSTAHVEDGMLCGSTHRSCSIQTWSREVQWSRSTPPRQVTNTSETMVVTWF